VQNTAPDADIGNEEGSSPLDTIEELRKYCVEKKALEEKNTQWALSVLHGISVEGAYLALTANKRSHKDGKGEHVHSYGRRARGNCFTDRILRRAVFSGKYNRVTVCRMVGVDPKTGRLIFYSCCNQGNRNNNFADPHYELPLEDDEAVCIDKGIKSAEDVYNFVVVPQFKHSRRTTPDWQRQRNYDVSHFRILVENTIAFLKDFNIIGHKFRANGTFEEILGKNDVVFHSVAWLHACFLHPEGIRKTPVKRYSIK